VVGDKDRDSPGPLNGGGTVALYAAGLVGCLSLGLVLLLGLGWWGDEDRLGERPYAAGGPAAGVVEPAPLTPRDVAAVMATFPAPAGLPTLGEVPVDDQGIALRRPLRTNVYLLQQMSTGRYITDKGRLVLVDDSGRRLLAGPTAQPE
jgi:hypothetical protein